MSAIYNIPTNEQRYWSHTHRQFERLEHQHPKFRKFSRRTFSEVIIGMPSVRPQAATPTLLNEKLLALGTGCLLLIFEYRLCPSCALPQLHYMELALFKYINSKYLLSKGQTKTSKLAMYTTNSKHK